MKHTSPALADMPGMWRRSLLIEADGRRDSTTLVRWLQAQSLYVDLRQSAALADFLHLRCLLDLTQEDCAQLALQEGFAGHLGFDGDCFEWQRLIDFQPRGPRADAGRLWWEGQILIEAGRDLPYIEHWLRDPSVTPEPLAALQLRDPEQGTQALAVQVGTIFMFARDRTALLPAAPSLSQCVAGAASVQQARAMVDCEISLGSAGPGANVILASTHPWRVGERLQLVCADSTVTTVDLNPAGQPISRRWEVIGAEGDAGAVWAGA